MHCILKKGIFLAAFYKCEMFANKEHFLKLTIEALSMMQNSITKNKNTKRNLKREMLEKCNNLKYLKY